MVDPVPSSPVTTRTPPVGAGTPDPLDLDAARQLEQNKAARLQLIRARAEKWIAGATALSGTLGVVLVVKGRDTVTNMPLAWRAATAATLTAAFALLAFGMFRAYQAAYGTPGRLEEVNPIPLTGLHSRLLEAREIAAARALNDVAAATKTVAAAIALVMLGVAITWFAPTRTTASNKTICLYYGANFVTELATDSAALRRSATGATVSPCPTTTTTTSSTR